jgi:hypothetical protein
MHMSLSRMGAELLHPEQAMFALLMDFRQLIGVGPQVTEHAIDLLLVYASPF